MRLLLGWAALTIVAYAILTSLEPTTKEHFDPYIVGLIGGTLLAAGLMMLFFTHTWTTRALGIMGTAFGCAVLYLGSLLFYAFPETKGMFEYVTDSARAFLIVSGPMFAFGIAMWARQYILSRSDEINSQMLLDGEGD